MARAHADLIGQRLRARRLALKEQDRKWTQSYVANEVNKATGRKADGPDVSRWEKGLHYPEDDTLEALATLYGLSLAALKSTPADKRVTPDPFEAKSEQSHLDRVERKLDALLAWASSQKPKREAVTDLALALEEIAQRTDRAEFESESDQTGSG